MSTEEIVKLLSAFGIGSILSVVFGFIQFHKRNQLDYITKERSEWRKQLKEIIKKLNDGVERTKAINELKNQINPYGRNIDIKNTKPYFMKDGHIWDILDVEGEVNYDKLTFFVELLLKYDWERSKKEVDTKPYKFIHEVVIFILLVCSLYCVYLAYKNTANLEEFLIPVNIGTSLLVVLLLLMQKMITVAVISNPSKKNSERLWVFIILYAIPYGYIMNNLADSLGTKESSIIKIIALVGLIIYEFYYLSFFDSCEDEYVKEIERYLSVKSKKYQVGIRLTNQIRDKEDKLYRYEYDISVINSMNKRLNRIKKKLTKKKRPQDPWLHPILFFKYRKDRSRIIREVKKVGKGELT